MTRRYVVLNLDDETDSAELLDDLNENEWPERHVVAVFSDPLAYMDTVRTFSSRDGTEPLL